MNSMDVTIMYAALEEMQFLCHVAISMANIALPTGAADTLGHKIGDTPTLHLKGLAHCAMVLLDCAFPAQMADGPIQH